MHTLRYPQVVPFVAVDVARIDGEDHPPLSPSSIHPHAAICAAPECRLCLSVPHTLNLPTRDPIC